MATTDTDNPTVDGLTFEQWPPGSHLDETDVCLRAYIQRMSEEQLAEYNPDWSDEELMEWDGNFRMDNTLMLVCVERDVEPDDYREAMKLYQEFRAKLG